jgi:phosphopantothenoylcysteine decarboxylase/phosphopantothenate--cysteine ligase
MNIQKHILIGITGGIGAYKSAELVRLLREANFEVKVVMTSAAKQFITPLTLQALSGSRVYDSLWGSSAENGMDHIELAKWADLILIAPATADCLARLAHGLADDLLTTICLASTASLAVAPAMNQAMWHHPATQANLKLLKERNVIFFGPEEGIQACGDQGIGRMQEPEVIVKALQQLFDPPLALLGNLSIMITAGPTQEAIDPVRYISNHSSGKMGYALAQAAQEAGANVILISGPTYLDCPDGVKRIDVKSVEDMQTAVMKNIENIDIFIGAAAVADYRPEAIQENKIKKTENENTLVLKLIKNPDILAHVAKLRINEEIKKKLFVVGFCAETENHLEYAQQKKIKKNLDMIIANPVNEAGGGFYSDNNRGWIISNDNTIELPLMSKKLMAKKILEVIASTKK